MKRYTNIKDDVNCEDILYMNPWLLKIYAFTIGFCHQNGIKPVITSIHRKPNDGFSKSSTHQTFRAFDLSAKSIHGWDFEKTKLFIEKVNEKFKHYGAISASDYEQRPIVYHDAGSGLHFHLQTKHYPYN